MNATCPQCGGKISETQAYCPECLKRVALREASVFDQTETGGVNELVPESLKCQSGGRAGGPDVRGGLPSEQLGDYELLEPIGRGAMGTVYKARHTRLNRLVALKLIRQGAHASESERRRFLREAEAVARLQHPHIVTLYETGEAGGQPYFAMEYVAGKTLAQVISENPLAPRRAAECLKKISDAVHYAHQHGVLHRDLKPSNVALDLSLEPRVMDFGLARLVEEDSEMTLTGMAIGSPSYMAPEQAAGKVREVSAASDVYALGAILYETLTGRPPFQAESSVETMRQVVENEPVSPRLLNASIPRDLETICLKCLQKEPQRRYVTSQALAEDLGRFLRDQPIRARASSRTEKACRWCRRNPALASTGTVGLLLLLAVAVGSPIALVRIDRERLRAEQNAISEGQERKRAVVAENEQSRLRVQAEAQEISARRIAYAADINSLQTTIANNRFEGTQALLDGLRPQKGHEDLRNWEWRYLWQYCHREPLRTLCQASNSIWSLSCSFDGKWLAIGEYEDGGLSVWGLGARHQKLQLTAGDGKVHVAFSPTEPMLAYSAVEGPARDRQASVRFWDARAEQEHELSLASECLGLAYSADGQKLSAATASQITVWRTTDWKKLASYAAHQTAADEAIPFAITSDATLAAYGSPMLHLLDLLTGQERWQAQAANELVIAVAFSPDGNILATAGGYTESSIRLWDVHSGKEITRLEGHGFWVGGLVFWPDGKSLASVSSDGTTRVWNLVQVTNVPRPRIVGIDPCAVWRVALLPGRNQLVSGGIDGSVRVWDTAIPEAPIWPVALPSTIRGAWHFAPDSQSVLTAVAGRVTRWSGMDFQKAESLMDVGASHGAWPSVFSRDCQFLAASSEDGTVQVWDLTRRELGCQFKSPGSPFPVFFLSNGRSVAFADQTGGKIHEWEMATGREVRSWRMPQSGTHWLGAFTFSPDDREYVCLDDSGTVSVYDRATGRERSKNLFMRHVEKMRYSFDARCIAALDADRAKVRLWDASTLTEIGTLETGGNAFCFSPDGKRLAVGGAGKDAVSIWDLAGYHRVLALGGQSSHIFWCEFSPDGNVLGALNQAGVLLLWRAPSPVEVERAEGLR